MAVLALRLALVRPLVLALFLLAYAQASETVTSGGWRPISRERVFNWDPNPRDHHLDPLMGPFVNGDGLIQVVNPPKSLQAEADAGIGTALPFNRRHSDTASMEPEHHDTSHRRGKKLDFVPNLISNGIASDKQALAEINEESSNTYEVTENTEENEQIVTTADKCHDGRAGNHLTDNLSKILNSYNIRSDDRLANYALSLKPEGPKSNGYVYRAPWSNSRDHAPADPLLAVFRSHYGHYLPGLFGVGHGFRNLYGYSASNSIHNNQPFGSYKIFADSDSAV